MLLWGCMNWTLILVWNSNFYLDSTRVLVLMCSSKHAVHSGWVNLTSSLVFILHAKPPLPTLLPLHPSLLSPLIPNPHTSPSTNAVPVYAFIIITIGLLLLFLLLMCGCLACFIFRIRLRKNRVYNYQRYSGHMQRWRSVPYHAWLGCTHKGSMSRSCTTTYMYGQCRRSIHIDAHKVLQGREQ